MKHIESILLGLLSELSFAMGLIGIGILISILI